MIDRRTRWQAVVVVAMFAAAATAASGCGGDDASGLAGIYRVSTQVKIRGACEGAGEAQPIDPAFFVIVDQPLVNGLFVDVYRCASADRSSCDENGFPLAFLAERVGSEWIAEQLQRSADPSGMGCFVQWTGTRIVKTGAGVQLRSESRAGTRPPAECAAAEPAISSGRNLPCAVVDVREATPAGM